MLYPTALALFESTDSPAVLSDPAHQDWLTVVGAVSGECYEVLARRPTSVHKLLHEGNDPGLLYCPRPA